MEQQITSAFSSRVRPVTLTDVSVCSSLREDALQFADKDWNDLTPADWRNYSDAFYGLAPDAFAYFLPSILSLSLRHPNEVGPIADALVMCLDTSADPDIWPIWFSDRFCLLTSTELCVVRKWTDLYIGGSDKGVGSEFARVQNTITMLEMVSRA